ncbi:MAG: hypothetical protein DRP78_04430 [Candidatus Omnitrophota bacterium]|nr:MAG: hypothetical protein DRP78_04430 [Candidatus Omnitrophota bacterium]
MAEEQIQTEKEVAQVETKASAAKVKQCPPKVEIPKNCAACKKAIGKIRYYRNMKFFCNKKCWKNFKKKEEEKKQAAAVERK